MREPPASTRLIDEVFNPGPGPAVPEARDMGMPDEWREIAQDPVKFEELRRVFGLPPNKEPTIPDSPEMMLTPPQTSTMRQPTSQPERVPVSTRPLPTRTKPLLPARSVPERVPVQQTPAVFSHPVSVEQSPIRSTNPAPEQPKTLTPVQEKALTPVKEQAPETFNEKLPNPPQNDNFSLNVSRPSFRSKLTKKVTFRGRRGRQRTNAEVIELLTYVQTKGVWPREISDQMQRYYKREYPEYFRKSRKRKVHA